MIFFSIQKHSFLKEFAIAKTAKYGWTKEGEEWSSQ